jgi:hypothetical protein
MIAVPIWPCSGDSAKSSSRAEQQEGEGANAIRWR